MNATVAPQVLQKYDISYARLLPMQKGYRNYSQPVVLKDGRVINLIFYKNEPDIVARIKNADAVANFAAKHGLPSRQSIERPIVRVRAKGLTKYGALYNYLPGSTIPWEAYTQAHLKMLGAAMSDLHAVLAAYQNDTLPNIADESLALATCMKDYIANPFTARALHKKLGLIITTDVLTHFMSLLRAYRTLPNQQPLHMDFVRGNILFDQNDNQPVVSGILDFEKTAFGHPVFDIARTLAFLIVDCAHKPEEKVRKYFLQSGYNKRGAATFKKPFLTGLDLLEELITFFLLHDFYKFLRHNPYESLPLNNHFTKTRDVLLKRGIIN